MNCEEEVSAILGVPLMAPWDHLVRLLCAAGLFPMEARSVLALCYLERTDLASGGSPTGTLSRLLGSSKR